MASVIVRKADDLVVDASDLNDLKYDTNTHDNLHPVTNPIPTGDDPRKYMRDVRGDIVKRPAADLIRDFEDERVINLRTKFAALKTSIPDTEPWKADFIALGQALGWDV